MISLNNSCAKEKIRLGGSIGVSHKMKKIKCVVFDLDNTLWSGILMENESVELKRRYD